MILLKIAKRQFGNCRTCIFIQKQCFASKNHWKLFKRDTEVLDLGSDTKSKTCLAVFGSSVTGALGIKSLANNDRNNGGYVRKMLPLYCFSGGQKNNTFGNVKINNVACGYGFTLFTGRSSRYGWQVFGCGLNDHSQLGFEKNSNHGGSTAPIIEPRPISLAGAACEKLELVAAGRSHSAVIARLKDEDGPALLCWGSNSLGQCGRYVIPGEVYAGSAVVHRVNNLPSGLVRQLVCGEDTTFVLMDSGRVYAFGDNEYGQLGRGDSDPDRDWCLQEVTGPVCDFRVRELSCRSNTVLALTECGRVFGWGDNNDGQVFTDVDRVRVDCPHLLFSPGADSDSTSQTASRRVTRVTAGSRSCAVIDETGQVLVWGSSLLGLGPKVSQSPRPQPIPAGIFGTALASSIPCVRQLELGHNFGVAITDCGSVFVWGYESARSRQLQTFPLLQPLYFRANSVAMGADHLVVLGRLFQ